MFSLFFTKILLFLLWTINKRRHKQIPHIYIYTTLIIRAEILLEQEPLLSCSKIFSFNSQPETKFLSKADLLLKSFRFHMWGSEYLIKRKTFNFVLKTYIRVNSQHESEFLLKSDLFPRLINCERNSFWSGSNWNRKG